MWRPDFVGRKSIYLNPLNDKLTTANIAATDIALAAGTMSPYAYTATVREDYDSFNFYADDGGSVIPASTRWSVGLFIAPQLERGNMIFQLSGTARGRISGTAVLCNGGFFFGRKATNNTVVSDKTAPQNPLAIFQYLPSNLSRYQEATTDLLYCDNIETELFSLGSQFTLLSPGFVYCFGYYFDSPSANAPVLSTNFGIHLSIRCYSSEKDVFRPRGT